MELNKFSEILTDFFKKRNPDIKNLNIQNDTLLIENGILDSFALTDLVIFIESITGSDVEVERLQMKNVSCISEMYKFFIQPG